MRGRVVSAETAPPPRPPGSWTTRVSWLLLQLHRHALHAQDLRLPHVGHGLVRRAAHPHGGEAAHADVADRRDDGRAVGTPLTDHWLGAIAVVVLVIGDALLGFHPFPELDQATSTGTLAHASSSCALPLHIYRPPLPSPLTPPRLVGVLGCRLRLAAAGGVGAKDELQPRRTGDPAGEELLADGAVVPP